MSTGAFGIPHPPGPRRDAKGVPGPLPIRPGQVPKLHRQIIQSAEGIANDAQVRGWMQDPEELGRMAGAVQATAERAQVAELFLATRNMAQMAVDAARDVPPMVVPEVQPSFDGCIFFDGGLPPMWIEQIQGSVVGNALSWTRSRGCPVLILWAHTPGGPLPWVPLVLAEVSDPESPADPDSFAMPQSGSTLALALAAWHLMSIPTVAEARPTTQPGPKVGRGKRRAPDRQVKVVDLRRLARKPLTEEESSEGSRTYRHQWVVRGHWRQQPVGKGRSERRTTWVPSYVKGPEGAPFLPSQTVFVWRR